MTFRQRLWTSIPYLILVFTVLPILVGYLWLLLSSFTVRTEGLLPVGNVTLKHWSFLLRTPFGRGYPSIWRVTFNTFLVAASMTIIVILVSALAGYALARLNFPGRRPFLSLTLILPW